MTRDELIDWLWAKAEPDVYITKEQFVAGYEGWHLYDIQQDGKLVAIVAEKGPEMHFQPTGVPISRRIVKQVMQGLLDRHGHVVTKTPQQELRQQRFNELIGFRVTGRDEYDVHYRIDADPGLRI